MNCNVGRGRWCRDCDLWGACGVAYDRLSRIFIIRLWIWRFNPLWQFGRPHPEADRIGKLERSKS